MRVTRRRFPLPLLLACASAAGALQAAGARIESPARPVVLLIATGGTISTRQGPRLTAAEIVASAPGVERHVRAEAEQFTNVDSNALTLDDWVRLSKRIAERFATRPDLAGIVVTMGTDTLEELSYFLTLTVRDPRPVVVTGALRPADAPSSDAAANVLAAFRVAGDPEARGLGTLVVLNEEIHAAREVSKTDSRRLHTFRASGHGPLGVVDPDRVAWHRRPVRRAGPASEFDITQVEWLPRVDLFESYASASGDLLTAARDHGARGLVVASAAGGVSPSQEDVLRRGLAAAIPVVFSSRTGAGRIAPDPAAQDWRRNIVFAEDLAPAKARVLLMLGLALGATREELARMFREY